MSEDQEVLLGVFRNSSQIEDGFLHIREFPIRGSVSVAQKLSESQIEMYYNDELGPKNEGFVGLLKINFAELNRINSDFKMLQQTKTTKTQVIAIPEILTLEPKPCEVLKHYTLYNPELTDGLVECKDENLEQHDCPLELAYCQNKYGFCLRNPAHFNITDGRNPNKDYRNKQYRTYLAQMIIDHAHFIPAKPELSGG